MQIRKIVGGLAVAAALAGVGVGLSHAQSLGDYVVTDTNALESPMIVVGETAMPSDVVGAVDIGVAVAGYATKEVAIGGGTGIGVLNGVDVSTPAKPLFIGSNINRGRNTLTDDNLPVTLKSSSLIDSGGTAFKFDQFIDLGTRAVEFSNSGGDIDDPAVLVNLGTSSTSPYITFRIDFEDAISFNASTTEGEELDIFGTKFTVDPDTCGAGTSGCGESTAGQVEVVLSGGGIRTSLKQGETTTVTIDGTEYVVEMTGTTSTTQAVLKVNGESKQITVDTSTSLGGLNLFLDDVFHFDPDSGIPSEVNLLLGARRVVLNNGDSVKLGEDADTVDNTLVTISFANAASGTIDLITIDAGAQDSNTDHLAAGQSILDPVFGSVKLAFNGLTPTVDDPGRTETKVDTSGNDEATIEFTDWNGNKKLFPFGFDTATGTTSSFINATNDDGDNIVLVEGHNWSEDDFFLTSIGDFDRLDFSHIWEVQSMSSLGTSNAEFKIKDFFSGDTVTVVLGADNEDVKVIDGKNFYFANASVNNKLFSVTWEDGAALRDPGNNITVYPLLKEKNGAKIALTANVTVRMGANGTQASDGIKLPTGVLFIDGGTVPGSVRDNGIKNITFTPQAGTTNGTQFTVHNQTAGLDFHFKVGEASYAMNFTVITGGTNANANLTNIWVPNSSTLASHITPSFMFVEGENDNNVYEAVVMGMADNSDGITIRTGSNVILTGSGGSTFSSLERDSKIEQVVDEWGTWIETNNNDQGVVIIKYPESQAIATLGIGSDPTFTTGGTTGTVQEAVRIENPVAKLDTEVETATLTSDLILVGGPCVNTLVSELLATDWELEAGADVCAAWFDRFGDGEGIIQEIQDAFGSGQKALIVAGTNADDTRALTTMVMQGTLSHSGAI